MTKKCCICGASKHVKFNEVPSDLILRAKWLAVIPSMAKLAENPVVCERHFQETDYEPSSKRRRLKKGVVPMVIPHEEIDFVPYQEEEDKERYLNFYHRQIQERSSELKDAQAKLQGVEETMKNITKEGGGVENQVRSIKSQMISLKEEQKKNSEKIHSLNQKLKLARVTCQLQGKELKAKHKMIKAMQGMLGLPKKDEQLKHNNPSEIDRGPTVKIKHGQGCDENLESIRALKEKVNTLLSEKKELEKNCYYKNIEQMIANMDTDRKAAFILDQIKLYNMKVPRYADTTLQECVVWEDTDPRGYQFVRESEFLTLPAQYTMKKYLRPSDAESEATGNVKAASVLGNEKEKSEKPISDKEVACNDHMYSKIPNHAFLNISISDLNFRGTPEGAIQ